MRKQFIKDLQIDDEINTYFAITKFELRCYASIVVFFGRLKDRVDGRDIV